MDRHYFQDIINNDVVAPYIRGHAGRSNRFLQDNDPKHTASAVFIALQEINWLKNPPESLDFELEFELNLNSIKIVWHMVNYYICNETKPGTKQ